LIEIKPRSPLGSDHTDRDKEINSVSILFMSVKLHTNILKYNDTDDSGGNWLSSVFHKRLAGMVLLDLIAAG
jgi:hypothetical protein